MVIAQYPHPQSGADSPHPHPTFFLSPGTRVKKVQQSIISSRRLKTGLKGSNLQFSVSSGKNRSHRNFEKEATKDVGEMLYQSKSNPNGPSAWHCNELVAPHKSERHEKLSGASETSSSFLADSLQPQPVTASLPLTSCLSSWPSSCRNPPSRNSATRKKKNL